jgi:hypothetical protein
VIVFANRDGAYIVIPHQFCELSHRGVRADPIDAFVHRVFDFHGGPPLLESKKTRRNATFGPSALGLIIQGHRVRCHFAAVRNGKMQDNRESSSGRFGAIG